MLTARSPTRSRSVLIFTAATIARRSAAIGWCSASSLKQRSSISMCRSLIGSSPTSTRSTSAASRSVKAAHRLAHALLGEAAHGEQPLLQRLELFLEMSDDALHVRFRPRG